MTAPRCRSLKARAWSQVEHPGMSELHTKTINLELADASATETLGKQLSMFFRPGDVINLCGDLGAVKTTLARAMIRAMAPGAGTFEVPSPTFTLVQTYEFTRLEVAHFDFYRLSEEGEALELGFPDLASNGIALVEWPDRASGLLPDERLEISLQDRNTPGRTATLTGSGGWAARLTRFVSAARFLEANGFDRCERTFLQGDASARRYERLASNPPAIFMDSPAQADGPPVRDGKPYSQIAHLAEDVSAFAGIAKGLDNVGLSAPKIRAADYANGMLIIEDFGDLVYGALLEDASIDMNAPYTAAVDVLCHLAVQEMNPKIELEDDVSHTIAMFDPAALEIEVELLLDWFWPAIHGEKATGERREEYLTIWRALWPVLNSHEPVWVLRDYHSPNLIWLPQRQGLKQVGLIDFQDAVLGHPAYDLVSLLQDARVDVSAGREADLLDYYCASRSRLDGRFDAEKFRQAYGVLAAQRNSKILGIFMRLKIRDGKLGYLKHIPRLSHYLDRTLGAPHLRELRTWYETWLPAEKRLMIGQGGSNE
jgi:tRNA threonylcarbamoyl adenosine modification protein YjeE